MKVIAALLVGCSLLASGALIGQEAYNQPRGCPCKDCKCNVNSHCGCYSDKGCSCSTNQTCGNAPCGKCGG